MQHLLEQVPAGTLTMLRFPEVSLVEVFPEKLHMHGKFVEKHKM